MITGTIVGGEALVERFARMPDRLRSELRVGVGRAVLLVQRESKENKLSGQALNVRSGRLRRSINTRVEENLDAVTGTVGTNVVYAGVHEFGFTGTVSVREHLRRTVSGKSAVVRAHAMNMRMPERSFLRSALAEMAPQIREELERATHRAVNP